MEIVSGMKIAAAIDDLATNNLETAEQEMAEQLAEEISQTFEVDPKTVPQRLINGMMRGSTQLKMDQIVEEVHRMQGRINDGRDAESLATRILNNVERQRKDIHRQRIQRSAVRQVLRSLSSDSMRSPGIEEWNSSSIFRMQNELAEREIQDPSDIYNWASSVLRLYYDIFVEAGERDSSITRNSKSQVSQGAAKNYSSAWIRFIEENEQYIFSHAQNSRLSENPSQNSKPDFGKTLRISNNLMSMSPPSYIREEPLAKEVPLSYEMNRAPEPAAKKDSDNVSVAVTELKSGEKPKRREMTWPSKASALQGLEKFFIVIENLVPNNARLDLVEISMTTNGATETLTLEEIDPAGLKAMLEALLTS